MSVKALVFGIRRFVAPVTVMFLLVALGKSHYLSEVTIV